MSTPTPSPDEVLVPGSPLEVYYRGATVRVGHATETDLGVVDERWIERFEITIGVAPSRRTGDRAVAPLNFLAAIHHWGTGPDERDLAADGIVLSEDAATTGLRSMGAGEEMEFFAPVTAGTRVILRSVLESVVAKAGRSGPIVFETHLNEFRDSDGRMLNRNRKTVLRRNPHDWRDR